MSLGGNTYLILSLWSVCSTLPDLATVPLPTEIFWKYISTVNIGKSAALGLNGDHKVSVASPVVEASVKAFPGFVGEELVLAPEVLLHPCRSGCRCSPRSPPQRGAWEVQCWRRN